jgi:hypothetical protein
MCLIPGTLWFWLKRTHPVTVLNEYFFYGRNLNVVSQRFLFNFNNCADLNRHPSRLPSNFFTHYLPLSSFLLLVCTPGFGLVPSRCSAVSGAASCDCCLCLLNVKSRPMCFYTLFLFCTICSNILVHNLTNIMSFHSFLSGGHKVYWMHFLFSKTCQLVVGGSVKDKSIDSLEVVTKKTYSAHY